MFTFWLFNKRYFILEKHSRVQTTKFLRVTVTPEKMVMSCRGERRKINYGGHFISFYLENRTRDQILYC
jgi:hypothetical protein